MPESRQCAAVIGIGNPDRGDDAAGPAVVRQLQGTLPPDVEIREHGGEVTSLIACLGSASTVYLIDACASGAPAGTVRRFDAGAAPLPHGAFGVSSHGSGPAEAIELSRVLCQLPVHCIVVAIEAGSFEPGTPLSPPVAAAVDRVAQQIRDEVSAAVPPVTKDAGTGRPTPRPTQHRLFPFLFMWRPR